VEKVYQESAKAQSTEFPTTKGQLQMHHLFFARYLVVLLTHPKPHFLAAEGDFHIDELKVIK